MPSQFETLPEPQCQRCGHREDVTTLELEGETHEVCESCRYDIQRRRFRR